jgi:hypothetical protein
VLRIRIWDPGSGALMTPGSGIWDKHAGSATLIYSIFLIPTVQNVKFVVMCYTGGFGLKIRPNICPSISITGTPGSVHAHFPEQQLEKI